MPKKSDPKLERLPIVDNYPPLRAWLARVNAKCLWQSFVNGTNARTATAAIEGWRAGKGVCILVIHRNKAGWDIFTADESNEIDESLADAERRLGLVKP